MYVTFLGILISLRCKQLANADSPISSIDSGKLIFYNEAQPLNASFPIEIIESGIFTVVKLIQSSNN